METLCAFLNGEGGTVLFGVKDNGKIIGQEVSDKTKREIAEAIRLIEPFATITVSYAGIPDKYPTSIVRLIELIGEHTCSLKEMMGMMELKDRENFLSNYLNPSMEAGLVEPLYPDQPKHPKQKYRLTEQGKALLQDGEKKN